MLNHPPRLVFLTAILLGHINAHPSPFSPRNLFKRDFWESIDWSSVHIDAPKGGWDSIDYPDWNDPSFYHDTPANSNTATAKVTVEVSSSGDKPAAPEQPKGGDHGGGQGGSLAPEQPGAHNEASPGTDIEGSDVCGYGGGPFRGCKTQKEMCDHITKNGQGPVPSECEASGSGGGGSEHKSKGKCGKSSAQCPPGCQMTIKFTSDSMAVPFTPGAGGHSQDKTTQNSCICMTGGSVRVNVGTTNPGEHTTLIEGNAAGLNDNSFFDVSYVEGYNYPVVCWNDKDPSRMSGHNVDLYERGKCSDSSKKKMGDICPNDGYDKLVVGTPDTDCWKCTLPSTFFEAAAGAAYTYPYDDCPCASDPMPDKNYQSPMANGGEITCCVGPDCCENTMSHGGQTKKGNCNRPDCRPCNVGFSWGHCSSACDNKKNKRSFERVLEQHSLRKRQKHHHHHSH